MSFKQVNRHGYTNYSETRTNLSNSELGRPLGAAVIIPLLGFVFNSRKLENKTEINMDQWR